MTIKDLLDRVKALRPSAYEDKELLDWLNRLETRIYSELVQRHDRPEGLAEMDGFEPYTQATPDDQKLLAPAPYDEVYEHYLMMQIDLFNLEYDKYNNSAMLYNLAWDALAAWWNRNYMPAQKVTHFTI